MKDDGTKKIECKCGNVIRVAPGAKLATPHCPVCGAGVEELRRHTRLKPTPKKAKA
jgi:hypothetical protein